MVGCSTESMHMSLSKLRKIVKDREAWHVAVHGLTKSWMQLRDQKITAMYFQVLDGLSFLLPVRSPRPQNFFQGGQLALSGKVCPQSLALAFVPLSRRPVSSFFLSRWMEASNICKISLPSMGLGHSGAYKEWVSMCSSNLHSIGSMNAYSWTFPDTFNNFTTLVTVCLIWYLELSDTNVDKNSKSCIHMSSASLGAPWPHHFNLFGLSAFQG